MSQIQHFKSTRLSEALGAVVAINTTVPEDAMTAALLGTDRSGNGSVLRDDGLIVTIAYLVMEADSIWISTADGRAVPGYVVAIDNESGLALVKPTMPLRVRPVETVSADDLYVGASVFVASCGGAENVTQAQVAARQTFAGRWEYVLDDALFTVPAHESWGGSALLDRSGRLCGIGSLLISVASEDEDDAEVSSANMFVPVDLLLPVMDDLCRLGRRAGPQRPWLGTLVQEEDDELVVVGVYPGCPADNAGLEPGD
ncbi:MAG: serine protease, partial [Gammaproteobacteria bacterium]|nr:serine protease [Gammaproteobacteria bacterium]